MKIALIQMNIVHGNPQENIAHARHWIEKAVMNGPDLIVLPEMWNTGYALEKIREIADQQGFPAAQSLAELARQYQVNILAGSVADLRDGNIYNTSYMFNRSGEQIALYDKLHLFGLMREGEYLSQGTKRVTFAIDDVSCGIIICYDLRFPELTRALSLTGTQLLFVPAQWPKPRLHPWRILLQARAIENQMYVMGVNRVGVQGKTEFFGHSMVVDPLGVIIAEGCEEEEILFADLDLEKVNQTRKQMTCFLDRRPELYI